MYPPPTKSGASSVSDTSWSGFLMSATVVSQSSLRLKEAIEEAIPTAIPVVTFARIDGKVTGKRVGSFIVLS